jgi:predicted nucleic acid-binding protein
VTVAERSVLLDTGPPVAFLNRGDRDRERCRREIEALDAPLLSTEAVLTEATHLLSRIPGGAEAAVTSFERGAALLVPPSRESLARCRELMRRHADVPMDFADASLVVLAEQLGTRRVLTLDRRGLETYRRERRGRFEIPPPRT